MLSGCLLYFLVILAMHNVHAVLPPRVDTLTRLDRNSLIEHYFHLGFDYSEILGFLFFRYGEGNTILKAQITSGISMDMINLSLTDFVFMALLTDTAVASCGWRSVEAITTQGL